MWTIKYRNMPCLVAGSIETRRNKTVNTVYWFEFHDILLLWLLQKIIQKKERFQKKNAKISKKKREDR